MKYLKITLSVFIATFIFAVYNAAAQTLTLINVTIPALKGTYMTSQQDKYNTNTQYIEKTECTDDLTGDGRAIIAKVHGMFAGMVDSSWVNTPKNQNVSFGSNSQSIGGWKLYLQSNKNLITTASFWGIWTID